MDRQSWFQKWKTSKKASPERLAVWGTVVILMTVVGFALHSGYLRNGGGGAGSAAVAARGSASIGGRAGSAGSEGSEAASGTAQAPQGIVATYKAAFESAEAKAEEVRHALEENQRLRYENDNLRLKLETARFDCREQVASGETAELGGAARSLASISYQIPDGLLPGQLYTLGVTYFKAGENEKAAVIFTHLIALEDNDAFRNARNYLMTGVIWYRLQNYDQASRDFDKALALPETDESIQFQAQARLWKGLVAKAQGNSSDTQHWLRELVDHHPHSMEATWVNSTEAERVPAESK